MSVKSGRHFARMLVGRSDHVQCSYWWTTVVLNNYYHYCRLPWDW